MSRDAKRARFRGVLAMAKHVPLFPCRSTNECDSDGKVLYPAKSPHIPDFKGNATQDVDQLKSWWTQYPDALPAMPTGERSGVLAIDLDTQEWEEKFKEAFKVDPPVTMRQKTKRGMHLLFKYNAVKQGFTVSAGKIGGVDCKGVDIRGEGGYIVVWPSPNYKFEGGFHNMIDLPDNIYHIMTLDRKPVGSEASATAETAEKDVLIKCLGMLDPKDFSSYELWRNLMMGFHFSSGADEDVMVAFDEWSAQDEDTYESGTVETLWKYMKNDREDVIGFGSIRKYVEDKHGQQPDLWAGKNGTFDGDAIDEDEGALTELSPIKSTALRRAKSGLVMKGRHNLGLIFEAENIEGTANPLYKAFRLNDLSQNAEYQKKVPWRHSMGSALIDFDYHQICKYISKTYRLEYTEKDMAIAIPSACHEIGEVYHPVKEYLQSLEWDEVPRLEEWLIKIGDVEDNIYTRAVSKAWLIGAVARAMRPGCKMDNALILAGTQGIKKSTLAEMIGGEWFRAPRMRDMGSKDTQLDCLGAWIVEIEELAGMKGSTVEDVKKFITTRVDVIRMPYGIVAKEYPRHYALIGTVNPRGDGAILRDSTGGRRFWPIRCNSEIRVELFKSMRDQLFAEAVKCFEAGEKWYLDDNLEQEAKKVQTDSTYSHRWEDEVRDMVTDGCFKDAMALSASEVVRELCGYMRTARANAKEIAEASDILASIGWERRKTRMMDHPTQRAANPSTKYVRPEKEQEAILKNMEAKKLDDIDIE